jgi:hypothetical protein
MFHTIPPVFFQYRYQGRFSFCAHTELAQSCYVKKVTQILQGSEVTRNLVTSWKDMVNRTGKKTMHVISVAGMLRQACQVTDHNG